jgi:eukaryotic-like serine/threonine-protein kinase
VLSSGLFFGLLFGLLVGLSGGLLGGGNAAIRHLALRTLLWHYNYIPCNYANFLDYCHKRILLRKVGGGYIFIHQLLLEHFKNMTNEDIECIADAANHKGIWGRERHSR